MMLSYSLFAQEAKEMKGSIGLTFSTIGNNDVVNSAGKPLIGGASYNGKCFYTIGVSYIYPLHPWIDIETGIDYSSHTITIMPNLPPDMDDSPFNKEMSLINIPVTARINIFKYFFINGGLMLDIETGTSSPLDSQNGIGALCGIGAKYSLSNGLGAFINGYYKFHSLIPFSADNDDYRWRITEGGLRFGLTYRF